MVDSKQKGDQSYPKIITHYDVSITVNPREFRTNNPSIL